MPVPQAATGDEDADADADDSEGDQADAPTDETEAESSSESAQATITDDDGDSNDGDDTPDVDPAEIDTVSVDGFDEVDETVDEALDELNDATERAEAEAEANGGTQEDAGTDIDVADTSLGEESPFDGTESESDYEYGSTGSEGREPFGSSDSGSDSPDDNLDEIIVEGFARLAVVKVEPQSEQSALQDEFEEVFEAFRLGYFGREVVQEYLIVDEHDDIDPLWGFVGSMFMCMVVVMWMRPDSNEILGTGTETLRDFVNGVRN